ncbi:Zinc finger, double-stranded RNA binding [Dillenia turbinata]|uniref:Zinc finger, double-stranded RNA binding n=1 Tax=Dillenia turbinata TaxID=194707 RepID=A0AAN8UY32_9MAGN
MAFSSSAKRCLYETLGVERNCTPDEIRAAYKKLALQRHPDKLTRSGLSEAEATVAFQELAYAYEVLSNPKERASYDSRRSQILFSDSKNNSSPSSKSHNFEIPNLFPYFSNSVFSGYTATKKGFYKVYGDIFNQVYELEVSYVKKLGLGSGLVKEAPIMRNIECDYSQVNAFYKYWLGFATVMDFAWVDEYDIGFMDSRRDRKYMEEENKKLRKKARREYNETVCGLALFVKKRDKRVLDMTMKKSLELERKKVEEKERRKRLEREKLEKARLFEEPEWARINEELKGLEEEQEDENGEEEEGEEYYCVACKKRFKSEKQWKNHERSKKHKEKVAELKAEFDEEDLEYEVERNDVDDNSVDTRESIADEEEVEEVVVEDETEDVVGSDEDEANVDELRDKFEDSLDIVGEKNESEVLPSDDDEDHFVDYSVNDSKKKGQSVGSDDEQSFLEAMVSGHKKKNKKASRNQLKPPPAAEEPANDDSVDKELMEYNNSKTTRRNRRANKQKNRKSEEAPGVDAAEMQSQKEDSEDQEIGRNRRTNKQKNRKPKEEAKRADSAKSSQKEERVEQNTQWADKQRNRKLKEEAKRADAVDGSQKKEIDEHDNSNMPDSTASSNEKIEANGQAEDPWRAENQMKSRKGAGKKEAKSKAKSSSKGRKQKV